MKSVTIENVKARIAELEGADQLIGLGLHAEFELACLRQLVVSLEAKPKWAVISSVHGSREMVTSYNPGVHVDGEKGVRLAYAVPPVHQTAHERHQVRNDHAEWSQATFGGVGPIGPLKHLSIEALEAAEAPGDLSEWADLQFLMWDAQRRAGITDEQITQAMIDKLAVNKARTWQEPKDGEPRLHVKEQPEPVATDEAPSLNAMMRALDAFYADDEVPERAMLAAFKILLADVGKQPAPEKYDIGEATMLHIFTATGMTDVSDMQAVFDQVEKALVKLERKPKVIEPDGWRDMITRLANGLELMTSLASERAISVDTCVCLEWVRDARAMLDQEHPAPVVPDDLLATFTRKRLLEIIVTGPGASGAEQNALARIALALMPPEQQEPATDNTAQQFEALATSAQPEIIGYEHRLICGELRRVPKFKDTSK